MSNHEFTIDITLERKAWSSPAYAFPGIALIFPLRYKDTGSVGARGINLVYVRLFLLPSPSERGWG